jgi:hypothetical protein
MVRTTKLLLIITILVVVSGVVSAYTQNSFSDGTSIGNLTFNQAGSVYKNIELPYWITISQAQIDLTGYKNSSFSSGYMYNQMIWNNTNRCYNITISQAVFCGSISDECQTNGNASFNYTLNDNATGVRFITTGLSAWNNDYVYLDIGTTCGSKNVASFKHLTTFGSCNPNTVSFEITNLTPSNNYYFTFYTEPNWPGVGLSNASAYFKIQEYYPNTYPTNLTIKTNNQITYYNNSNLSGTVNNINLNTSSLQSCVNSISSGNINCSVNFTSQTAGILQYSGLDVEYSEFDIDNCSNSSHVVLQITGKDEETDALTTMSLNLNLYPTEGTTSSFNATYQLSGNSTYNFCSVKNNSNIRVDGIMEYGDGTIYTKRKYYLNNFSIDTNGTSQIYLYHLNNSKASEITFTVYDLLTGDVVPGAYIKTLRYYPGENVYRIVEIGKTDEIGKTLGKMVLADVFYKFIIEKPAGQIKLNSDVLRMLSLTRSFGISFAQNYLSTWNLINDVSTSVTCTKGTQTCRLTWSDSSNIVQSATLEVWRTNGINDELLSTQTTSSAAGTITYTIAEDTLGNAYTAKGYIESNTDASISGAGIAGLDYPDNPFFNDQDSKIASLFPLLLLAVTIVFALIDFGAVGITIAALIGLVIGSIAGIMPLDPFYFISFILMAIILIYKLSK